MEPAKVWVFINFAISSFRFLGREIEYGHSRTESRFGYRATHLISRILRPFQGIGETAFKVIIEMQGSMQMEEADCAIGQQPCEISH